MQDLSCPTTGSRLYLAISSVSLSMSPRSSPAISPLVRRIPTRPDQRRRYRTRDLLLEGDRWAGGVASARLRALLWRMRRLVWALLFVGLTAVAASSNE